MGSGFGIATSALVDEVVDELAEPVALEVAAAQAVIDVAPHGELVERASLLGVGARHVTVTAPPDGMIPTGGS